MSINDEALKRMRRKFREAKAEYNYVLVKNDTGLMRTCIEPDSIKRSGGRPPVYMLQESSDDPGSVPTVIYKPKQIVQLVLKQKWQAGLPFSNNDSVENRCFAAVAELFDCHPREIRRKYYSVDKELRQKIEFSLVELLLEFNEIKPTRLKQANELLATKGP